MNSERVNCDSIQFEFVPIHTRVEPQAACNRLYLDCGNALGPGVVDHHHLPAYTGSTAGLIVRHPELVSGAIQSGRVDGDPFFIVVHEQPDLDCVVSASLAVSILTRGSLPAAADAVANYVDRVDAGYPGFSQLHPYALYSAYQLIVHDLAGKDRPDWDGCIRKGMEIVDHVLNRVSADGLSIWDIDAFECDRIFRTRDRKEIELDLSRYRLKLADRSKACRRLRLRLPGEFGGHRDIDGLFARDVQNVDDPERCVYFKDWARTDHQNSSAGNGFVALSIFVSESQSSDIASDRPPGAAIAFRQVRRCILSVAPGNGVTLRGLGELLEQAEAATRIELHGLDNRLTDPATGMPLTPRSGFDNSDPWYDGRGHNYTIVDSPRGGTVLTADQIEEIFIGFGAGSQQQETPNWLAPEQTAIPAPHPDPQPKTTMGVHSGNSLDSSSSTIDSANKLAQMSAKVENWTGHQPGARKQPSPPEIFISYPRLRIDWVESEIARPLTDSRGAERVFFDKSHLQAGMGWLAALADNVMSCRLFLPVYCPHYFQSDFCQWELQLALTRDPTGRKRIIVPVLLEPIELPAYCRLIQAQLLTGKEFTGRLLKLVNEILD